jgi:phosphate transport system substrate-binding protein
MPANRFHAIVLLSLIFPSLWSHPVTGGGSTFADPLYQAWITNGGLSSQMTYKGIGSEEGIKKFQAHKFDFAGTDWPLPVSNSCSDQTQSAPSDVLQIPTSIGGVAIIYNVDIGGIVKPLQFSPEVLASIFEGKITMWDDEKIQRDNARDTRADGRRALLPNKKIKLVHRSDGSGTTRVLTEYLSRYSSTWNSIGVGFKVHWHGGASAKGSEGVASKVQTAKNSIGYVEYYYATSKGSRADQTSDVDRPQRNLPAAYVQNRAKEFQPPSVETINAALPGNTNGSPTELECAMLDSEKHGAYPLSSITWVLIQTPLRSEARQVVCSFLDYGLTPNPDGTKPPGQIDAPGLGYVPLPQKLIDQDAKILDQVCH